jgi:hypothetical protein
LLFFLAIQGYRRTFQNTFIEGSMVEGSTALPEKRP